MVLVTVVVGAITTTIAAVKGYEEPGKKEAQED